MSFCCEFCACAQYDPTPKIRIDAQTLATSPFMPSPHFEWLRNIALRACARPPNLPATSRMLVRSRIPRNNTGLRGIQANRQAVEMGRPAGQVIFCPPPMACLISPTITIRTPPPTPPETIWPIIEPISRPPAPAAAAPAPAPPPKSAPMICAPTPPPITPAIELPTVPRLYCFSAEPAMLPPTAPEISWMIRPTIPPHMLIALSWLASRETTANRPYAYLRSITELGIE